MEVLNLENGFYWLRRRDDGRVTVCETFELGGPTIHILGNDELFDPEEIYRIFEVIGRVNPPDQKTPAVSDAGSKSSDDATQSEA